MKSRKQLVTTVSFCLASGVLIYAQCTHSQATKRQPNPCGLSEEVLGNRCEVIECDVEQYCDAAFNQLCIIGPTDTDGILAHFKKFTGRMTAPGGVSGTTCCNPLSEPSEEWDEQVFNRASSGPCPPPGQASISEPKLRRGFMAWLGLFY